MNAKQILLNAAAMVEADPSTWTTGCAAKDENGREVSPVSPRATCWCAMGFVLKSSEEEKVQEKAFYALRFSIPKGFGYSLPVYNDSISPLEFIQWSPKAAESCE